ncbi:response regulator [bacterium]|nr:response regulator [bacterium]
MPKEDLQPLILTIDDEKAIRRSFVDFLEDSDFRVIEADNGAKGLEKFASEHPDLVLLDLSMPEMDGFEVLKILTKEAPDTPIIVISGIGVIGDAIKAIRLGAWEYLLKPVEDLNMLEHVVEKCLERARLIRENRLYQQNLEKEVARRTKELDNTNKRLNEALIDLKNSEKKFRTLADTSPMAIMMFQDQQLVYTNSAGETITGYSVEELTSMDIRNLFHEDVRTDASRLLVTSQQEKPKYVRYELKIITKNNEVKWIDASGGYTDLQGKLSGIISFVDITDRKKHEETLHNLNKELERRVVERTSELQAMNAELKEAKANADEATLAKSAFLANMSHEIRTPMNGVIAAVDLALEEVSSPQVQRFLKIIQSSSYSLLGIINDVLDFSKIEAGKLEVEMKPFQLETVLNNAVSPFVSVAQEKDIDLLIDIEPGTPNFLAGDQLRIIQIISNLISNAIKFTNNNGTITIGVKDSQEPADKDYTKLLFYIRDTGIGMAPDQQERIFQPFIQADISTTRKYGGTGLGLSISKRLTELMDGDIWVKSSQGNGTTFYFTILLKEQISHKGIKPAKSFNFSDKTALIINNKVDSSKLLKRILESFGFQVDVSTSGDEATSILTHKEKSFDLMIIDCWISKTKNSDVYCRLSTTFRKTGPVILMAGIGQESKLDEALKQSVSCILYKPYTPSSLFNSILYAFGYSSTPYPQNDRSLGIIAEDYREKLRGAKILVAEDNPTNQEIAKAILEKAGIIVDIVDNGKKAVMAVDKIEYDAVLMDVQMPVMDGYEATRRIKSSGYHKSLPIIAMTAHAMKGDEEKCIESGMDGYVSKPINQDNLYAVLGSKIDLSSKAPFASPQEQSSEVPNILPEKLPGIEIQKAIKSLKIETEAYIRIVKKFYSYHKPLFTEFHSQVENFNDTDLLKKITHDIKGSSANIGAFETGELANKLDLLLTSEDIEKGLSGDINDLIEKLDSSLNLVFSSIETLLSDDIANQDLPDQKSIPMDKKNITDQLKDLREAIDNYNPEQIKRALTLLKLDNRKEDFTLIEEKLENYDYEEALKELNKFAKANNLNI